MKNGTVISLMIIMPILMVCNPVMAQQFSSVEDEDRQINFGFKGGINQFNLQGNSNTDIDGKSGYQFGIFLTSEILRFNSDSQSLKLRVEANYLRRSSEIFDNAINRVMYDGLELFTDEIRHGFEFDRNTGGPTKDDEIFDENVFSTISFDFIEAPFRFIYEFPIGSVKPYILAGPTFAIVVNYDPTFTLTTQDGMQHTQSDVPDIVEQQFNKINFSGDVGFGVQLPYGLFVEGYYSHGFTDVLEFVNSDVFHRGFVTTFGIQFNQ